MSPLHAGGRRTPCSGLAAAWHAPAAPRPTPPRAPAPLRGCTAACRASHPGGARAAARRRCSPAPRAERPAPRRTGWPPAARPQGWRRAACAAAVGRAARRGACRGVRMWAQGDVVGQLRRGAECCVRRRTRCQPHSAAAARRAGGRRGAVPPTQPLPPPPRPPVTWWPRTGAAAAAPRRARCEGCQLPGASMGRPARGLRRPTHAPGGRTVAAAERGSPCRPPCCCPGLGPASQCRGSLEMAPRPRTEAAAGTRLLIGFAQKGLVAARDRSKQDGADMAVVQQWLLNLNGGCQRA